MPTRAHHDDSTKQLKKLFATADNTGQVAWDIGDRLQSFKENRYYLSWYDTWEEYCRVEFNKSAQTIQTYLHIRERFPDREQITKHILVTHLTVIANFVNQSVGNRVLEALTALYQELQTQGNDPKRVTTAEVISIVLSWVASLEEEADVEQIKRILRQVNAQKRRSTKTRPDEFFGSVLKSKAFPSLSDCFENEPVDEMGTVALFCLLFPRLQGMPFTWNGETVALESIQYVRSTFPDASLRVRRLAPGREVCQFRSIEFEYQAFNYVLHKHHTDAHANKCRLIVCWENNLDESLKLPSKLKSQIPPVLELKEVLRTGKIILH
jgi:hypothetical protein